MSIICILSDTHDNTPIVERVLPEIHAIAPEVVIHCGDIQSAATLALFNGLPLRAVLGNCDPRAATMNSVAIELSFIPLDIEAELEVGKKKLYVTHGHLNGLVEEMAEAGVYDYIFHGHSHKYRDTMIGSTRVINPGALYRAPEYSYVQLDLESGEAKRIIVS